jgi:hypothetical protein
MLSLHANIQTAYPTRFVLTRLVKIINVELPHSPAGSCILEACSHSGLGCSESANSQCHTPAYLQHVQLLSGPCLLTRLYETLNVAPLISQNRKR